MLSGWVRRTKTRFDQTILVQIASSVFHQDPKEQNTSFKIIAMFTEVSEFHQVFTRFQKIPEVEKNARTSPKHSPGFCHFYQVLTKCLNFTRFSPGFGNFARFSPSFGNFSFFDQLSKFHQVSGFGLPHIRRGSSSRERERSRTMANEMEVGVEPG